MKRDAARSLGLSIRNAFDPDKLNYRITVQLSDDEDVGGEYIIVIDDIFGSD